MFSFIIEVETGRVITLDVGLEPLTKEPTPSGERLYQVEPERTGFVEFDIYPLDAVIYIDNALYGTAS